MSPTRLKSNMVICNEKGVRSYVAYSCPLSGVLSGVAYNCFILNSFLTWCTCVLCQVSLLCGVQVSYIKAIDVWVVSSLIFVFSAFLEFAYVNVLARRGDKEVTMAQVFMCKQQDDSVHSQVNTCKMFINASYQRTSRPWLDAIFFSFIFY